LQQMLWAYLMVPNGLGPRTWLSHPFPWIIDLWILPFDHSIYQLPLLIKKRWHNADLPQN
jgi:hypothetical protein